MTIGGWDPESTYRVWVRYNKTILNSLSIGSVLLFYYGFRERRADSFNFLCSPTELSVNLTTKGIDMDEDEYYKKCIDPFTWLSAGRQLYNSTIIIFDIWTAAINKPMPRMGFTPTYEELNACQEKLIKSCELFPVYMMLMGYALENLSKGLELMEKTKPGGTSPKCLNPTIKSLGFGDHNTLERLERLEIFLTPEEREAVEITDDHVVWAGKYGVPKNPGQRASEDMPTSIAEWRKYADTLNPLFGKLYDEFIERAWRNFNVILG